MFVKSFQSSLTSAARRIWLGLRGAGDPLAPWQNGFRLAVIMLGAYSAWKHRYQVNPDGISYLDVGDAFLRGDWEMGLNTYWNPLYPLVLAFFRALTLFSARWEFQVSDFANFAIFVAALFSWDFLVSGILRLQRQASPPGTADSRESEPSLPVAARAFLVLAGYALFAWCSLRFVGLYFLTPDGLVGMFVFLIAGMLVRFRLGNTGFRPGVILGVLCGLSYLAKAAMLFISLGFLFFGWFAAGGPRRGFKTCVASVAAFVLVVGSYVALLSWDRGYVTYGDSGRLAQAWLLNGVRAFAHAGANQGPYGTLVHTPRVVHRNPPVYEFATPIRATYPLWFDAPYWYEGIEPHVTREQQINRLHYTVDQVQKLKDGELLYLRLMTVLFVLALLTAVGRWWRRLLSIATHYYLILPGLAALFLYMTLNVLPRYIGPFVALVMLAALGGIHFFHARQESLLHAAVAVAAVFLMSLGVDVRSDDRFVVNDDHWRAAERLHELGVAEGDPVGHIGYTFGACYARLGRFRIISEVNRSNSPAFWRSPESRQAEVLEAFRRTGVKVVVGDHGGRGNHIPGRGWVQLAGTSLYAYFFDDLRHP